MKLVSREIWIDAPAALVFELLTEATHLVEWMAVEAHADAVPGGLLSWRQVSGDVVEGRFIEVVPDRRVVFSYGWQRADIGVPPGSTTVEIDLLEEGARTLVRLRHHGLVGRTADAHSGGWKHYLSRLAALAAGQVPGPDPWVNLRPPASEAPLAGAAGPTSEELFLSLGNSLLARAGVTRSTMMGLPCLRVDGRFFASFDRRTGDLLVKLSADRVDDLVSDAEAVPFAPTGRRFREWAAIHPGDAARWSALLGEAFAFVAWPQPGPSRSRRRTGGRTM